MAVDFPQKKSLGTQPLQPEHMPLVSDSDLVASMLEIRHWMWPLFDVARWGLWRACELHLPTSPFFGGADSAPFQAHAHHNERNGHVKELHCESKTRATPPADMLAVAPLLLYGFSHRLSPVPIPRASSLIVATGLWRFDECMDLSVRLETFLQRFSSMASSGCTGSRNRVVAISFGSMGKLGFLGTAHMQIVVFLKRLVCMLCNLDAFGVLVTSGCAALETAWETVVGEGQLSDGQHCEQRLFVETAPCAFDALFPRCCAVLHHGGSGTTATAAFHGLPQAVCPFMWDQFGWANTVHRLGLGPAPLQPDDVFASADIATSKFVATVSGSAHTAVCAVSQQQRMEAALQTVLGDAGIRANCQQLMHKMREDHASSGRYGCKEAVSAIQNYLAALQRAQRGGSLRGYDTSVGDCVGGANLLAHSVDPSGGDDEKSKLPPSSCPSVCSEAPQSKRPRRANSSPEESRPAQISR
eukprot:INCI20186.1.p1 GENE.INCI20186.1~~INCI20186.1.p1  ORF type:complete len:471 (-),score=63.73 INCI20186.1:134-1546(-)